MKLGELKKSLKKFPPDMDEMELMAVYSRNNKRVYENLCFVGYCPLTGKEFIVIGTLSEIQRMVENGEMKAPENYISPEEMKPFSPDEEDGDEPGVKL